MRVDRFMIRASVIVSFAACASPPSRLSPPLAPSVASPAPIVVAPPPPALPSEPSWTPPIEQPVVSKPFAIAGPKPERCAIRIAGTTIFVDGDPMKRQQAVASCMGRKAAMIELAEDASEAEWRRLRADLVAVGIPIMLRGKRNDTHPGAPQCMNNPLAKGCM
jgi:hypothetical protein